jgi:predicted nucleic acid-binding protein
VIILDTNIIAEMLRPAPAPQVDAWLSAQKGRGWRGFHHHATLCIAVHCLLRTDVAEVCQAE